MLTRSTPPEWRKGYTLHRRRTSTDRLGQVRVWYDMDNPDLTIDAGSENAVCWQDVRVWQSGGSVTSGGTATPQGERFLGVLQGALFGSLPLSIFDRLVIDGDTYELRKVQNWSGYRWLQLQRIR